MLNTDRYLRAVWTFHAYSLQTVLTTRFLNTKLSMSLAYHNPLLSPIFTIYFV